MTEENEPFSFATPFTVPDVEPVSVSAPEAEEKTIEDLDSIIEDVDSMTVGQTISVAGIVHDDIYDSLKSKYENEISLGKLEISYHRTDDRENHEKWAEGGTLTVTRK